MSLEQWVRVVTNTVLLIPATMATVYCVWIWLRRRQLYLLFGVLALTTFIPLLLLRIASVPEPQLLSPELLSVAGLIINALTSIFGMAWLVGLLREYYRISKLQHKYFDEIEEE